MKRFLSLLLFLFIFLPAAAADPLSVAEDYAEDITVYYNGTDDSDGRYLYSYRYPRVSDEDPGDLSAVCVNEFYRKKIQEYKSDYIPSLADYYGSIRRSVTVKISYEITCNNDEFFSVLIRRTEDDGDEISESWEGNTFSRSSDMIGSLTSVPHLLGILDYGESDEWLEDRQSQLHGTHLYRRGLQLSGAAFGFIRLRIDRCHLMPCFMDLIQCHNREFRCSHKYNTHDRFSFLYSVILLRQLPSSGR